MVHDPMLIMVFKSVVDAVNNQIYEMLLDLIDQEVYDAGSPQHYVSGARFGMDEGTLRGSFFKTKAELDGDIVSAKIYHDYTALDHAPWNFVHGSDYWEETDDIRPYLIDIIIGGKSGGFFGEGYWRERRDFWTPLMILIDSGLIDRLLKIEFLKYGIKYG